MHLLLFILARFACLTRGSQPVLKATQSGERMNMKDAHKHGQDAQNTENAGKDRAEGLPERPCQEHAQQSAGTPGTGFRPEQVCLMQHILEPAPAGCLKRQIIHQRQRASVHTGVGQELYTAKQKQEAQKTHKRYTQPDFLLC